MALTVLKTHIREAQANPHPMPSSTKKANHTVSRKSCPVLISVSQPTPIPLDVLDPTSTCSYTSTQAKIRKKWLTLRSILGIMPHVLDLSHLQCPTLLLGGRTSDIWEQELTVLIPPTSISNPSYSPYHKHPPTQH
ncbi:hypothetical protein GALMADRAFT_810425 [Galerina marginata CBS 339.88]|uniref:Uncharacterized protein n=1 Tax=Galerina marginata (strain CBS 339.88) TaxID=685588 RepID=A0A067SVM7_GALM3|nr:hypothetical protein GALMADRAFT_810425 [Galerina marginata CBS 339.88]